MKRVPAILVRKGVNLGSELFDTGVITNLNGGIMAFTATGIDAESDGSSTSILRPRLLWNSLTIGANYRLQISNLSNTGATNILNFYDGSNYIVGNGGSGSGSVDIENMVVDFTVQGSNVFLTLDGREIFTADFDLSLREIL